MGKIVDSGKSYSLRIIKLLILRNFIISNLLQPKTKKLKSWICFSHENKIYMRHIYLLVTKIYFGVIEIYENQN